MLSSGIGYDLIIGVVSSIIGSWIYSLLRTDVTDKYPSTNEQRKGNPVRSANNFFLALSLILPIIIILYIVGTSYGYLAVSVSFFFAGIAFFEAKIIPDDSKKQTRVFLNILSILAILLAISIAFITPPPSKEPSSSSETHGENTKDPDETTPPRTAREIKQKEEADKLIKQIRDLEGSIRNTSTADIQGDPNASQLKGISTGSGRIGGGLGSRGVLKSPAISENPRESGTVVVSVCVDEKGEVISAEFTAKGSTTEDRQLVNAAVRNAKDFQFSEARIDRQCGTISYNFK